MNDLPAIYVNGFTVKVNQGGLVRIEFSERISEPAPGERWERPRAALVMTTYDARLLSTLITTVVHKDQ